MVYDSLKRVQKLDVPGLDRNYVYRDISSTRTTTQVSKLWYGSSESSAGYAYSYTYDAAGNIVTYNQNGTAYTYTYDAQNQLLSSVGGLTNYYYTYDTAGNILTAKRGSTTYTYTYGNPVWKDQLTAFNGETITYDGSGNPTSYYNGTRYAFTWANGRQLTSVTTDTLNASYTYDGNGLRLAKTVDGVTHYYYYAGDRLVKETYGDNTLEFYYDHSGRPYTLVYNGTPYYYMLNLQGDVIALITGGSMVAYYTYDPYGRIASSSGTLASTNPLRYRGYYQDTETGFYYLQSRYYDPEICRFINADAYASTGQGILGHNMYAYCNNNPETMIDVRGYWPDWIDNVVDWVVDFFGSDTGTIAGDIEDGCIQGSGSLTAGYSEFNGRLQVNSKNTGTSGMIGAFGKASVGNANGKIGVGNDDLSISVKGVGDGLTATAQAGIQYKDGLGFTTKAKASILSGRATVELNLFGWQIEVGASGDLLSAGVEATAGYFPEKGLTINASVGAGLFGLGFLFRVKPG